MKSKLIALALALISVIGSLAVTTSSTGARTIPLDQSFDISQNGTLVKIFREDGNSRFGDLNLNGFELRYKLNGSVKTIRANGESDRTGILPGHPNLDGRSANITVKTDDEALEITNHFILDRQAKKLTIHFSVRNAPGKTARILSATQYLDPRLIGAMAVGSATPLRRQARAGIRATTYASSQFLVRPPVDPPCLNVVCLANHPAQPMLAAIPSAGASVQNRISLHWNRSTLIGPQSNAVRQVNFTVWVDLNEGAN